MSRYKDIESAIFDVVTQALYDPIDYLTVAETIADDYGEYVDDDAFITAVYDGAGDVIRKIFEKYTGSGT